MRQQFYVLGPTFKPKWFWGSVLTPMDCERLAIKGMRDYKRTVEIEIVEGKQPGDFLWSDFSLIVVSQKVMDIWKKYQAYDTYPVVVKDHQDLEYTGVAFTGRGGPFDPIKSKVRYLNMDVKEDERRAIAQQEGLFFDDESWDGSDLLTVDDFPCIPVITEHVKIEMDKAKVTNCRYDRLEDYGKIEVPKFD